MRSVTLNTECEAAQGAGWRHGLILWLKGMPWWGEEAWIPSPSGMAKYLPSSTWLSRHIHSAPFPITPLFCSKAARAGTVSQAGRQTRDKKSFSSLPEVTEVQQPGKNGLCIFKTSGPTFGESHAHQARDGWIKKKKKRKLCQMVFVLPNDLEKGTLRTRRAVSADFSELVFHIHHLFFHAHMAGF